MNKKEPKITAASLDWEDARILHQLLAISSLLQMADDGFRSVRNGTEGVGVILENIHRELEDRFIEMYENDRIKFAKLKELQEAKGNSHEIQGQDGVHL